MMLPINISTGFFVLRDHLGEQTITNNLYSWFQTINLFFVQSLPDSIKKYLFASFTASSSDLLISPDYKGKKRAMLPYGDQASSLFNIQTLSN